VQQLERFLELLSHDETPQVGRALNIRLHDRGRDRGGMSWEPGPWRLLPAGLRPCGTSLEPVRRADAPRRGPSLPGARRRADDGARASPSGTGCAGPPASSRPAGARRAHPPRDRAGCRPSAGLLATGVWQTPARDARTRGRGRLAAPQAPGRPPA
jgi:hypothetical protein